MNGVVLVGLIAVNLINLIQTAGDAAYLYTLGLAYPVLLRVVVSGVWVAVFGWLLVRVIRGDRRAWRWVAPALTVYGASGVVWLLVFAQSDFGRGRIGFQAMLTVILLVPVWWLR